MLLVDFPGSNLTLHKPENMTDEECQSARVFHGIDHSGWPFFLLCFKPSKEDMEAFSEGRELWLKVLTDAPLAPVELFTCDAEGNANT